jgi:signal transduction histidine kinase
MLDNLWDNACKYSEPGNPVTIRMTAEANAVVLSVTDAGRGVAEADLPHIFEPFYRAAPARMHGISGIGLGLAVVQRIVKGFGGTITATSQPGQGTSFQVRFPIEIADRKHAEISHAQAG